MIFDLDNRQMVLDVDFENKETKSHETILENTIYFGHQNLLVGVDVITGKVNIEPFQINAIVRDPVELENGCITGLCFDGDVYNYDTKTGSLSFRNIKLPKKPVEIRQLHIDSNDMLYASGYLRGGTIVSDLNTGSWFQYEGVGQCEGITSYNGKIYLGKYPGSYVYEYDPDGPWDMQNGNPRLLFDLKVNYRQDRPFAMIAAEGRLFVGSIPDYGQIDGGLTLYDIVSGTSETRFDFSPNRSIVSLAVSSRVLFGGTTVCGGLGSHTVHSSGTLFAMDIESGEILFDRVLFDGKKNIGGLIALSDGRITGCADSTFFIYDPISAAVDMAHEIAPHDPDRDYRWQISFMKIAPDGIVYGVTGWRLFRFNPATEAIDVLCDEDVYLLEIDSSGRIYTRLESDVRTIVRFG
ncbi:MAG: hypothetical protein HN368_20130, partial [Spirochaetales bacterium]|nr:hypothetical protein [Spirochaetales bacterium]